MEATLSNRSSALTSGNVKLGICSPIRIIPGCYHIGEVMPSRRYSRMVPDARAVVTVGHGTLPAADLTDLLHGAGVEHVVDVRSYPASRRNPQYNGEQLERWLPAAGIGYSLDRRLGGRRRPQAGSANVALRHEAFRAYADHMATPEFREGLDDLVALAGTTDVAVMCAESVWWRCHRRLLADALVLLCGVRVIHLFHDGRLSPHLPSPESRVVDGRLLYDAGTTAPLL
jgi:uncharacterized protein (DUF488 family)